MATLTVQDATLSGTDVTFAAAAGGGDDFANTGEEELRVDNASGSPITVTADATQNCNQGFDHDAQVSVPAGEQRTIGPFPVDRFGSSVSLTYSASASVTVAVVKV